MVLQRRRLRPRDRPGRRLDGLGRGAGPARRRPAFGGYDVQGAVAAVNQEIAPALRGLDAADQAAVDRRLIELDGTPDKSRLGANATIAISMAAAHAAAAAAGEPLWRHLRPVRAALPLPEIQIFGGGAHAGRRVDIQDFMVVCPGAATFAQALEWTAEVYRAAGAPHGRSRQAQGRGRRGRLLAGLRDQRGGARDAGPRDRARGPGAGRAGRDRARRRRLRARAGAAATGSAWTAASWTARA